MKTNLLTLWLVAFALFAQAQTFDVSTGQGPGIPGTQDPWQVREMSSLTYQHATVVHSIPNGFAPTSCGPWISHDGNSSGIVSGNSAPGHQYFFKFYVDSNDCANVKKVTVYIDSLETSDSLIKVKVNGYALYNTGWYTTGTNSFHGMITVIPSARDWLFVGDNYFVVETMQNAPGSNSGIRVCASVEVHKCCTIPPTNLQASDMFNPAGADMLSWTDNANTVVPGAQYNAMYNLEITYNGGGCCGSATPHQPVLIHNIATTSYTFTPAYPCYKWRVRSRCTDNILGQNVPIYGAWSDSGCVVPPSTPPGPPLPPPWLKRSANDIEEDAAFTVLHKKTAGLFLLSVPGSESIVYRISDMNGRLIRQDARTTERSVEIDLRDQPPGIYVLSVQSGSAHKTFKLVKNE